MDVDPLYPTVPTHAFTTRRPSERRRAASGRSRRAAARCAASSTSKGEFSEFHGGRSGNGPPLFCPLWGGERTILPLGGGGPCEAWWWGTRGVSCPICVARLRPCPSTPLRVVPLPRPGRTGHHRSVAGVGPH